MEQKHNNEPQPIEQGQAAIAANPMLCDVTLRHIIKDCDLRLKELGERKQTSITLGRINEMQCLIVHLQQMVINNIA